MQSPWQKKTVPSLSLFFLISESHSLPSSGTQHCKPDCLSLPVSKMGQNRVLLQKQPNSVCEERALLRNSCPWVNHTQTDWSHQKSQLLWQGKKPNFSSGQPMLWKWQKPVMRENQPWFSLFISSIAGLQMQRSKPGARQQIFPETPRTGAEEGCSPISSFGQIWGCPLPELTGDPS